MQGLLISTEHRLQAFALLLQLEENHGQDGGAQSNFNHLAMANCTCPAVEALLVQATSQQQNTESLWAMTPTNFVSTYVDSSCTDNDDQTYGASHSYFSQMAFDLVDEVVDGIDCSSELDQFLSVWRACQDGPVMPSMESYAIAILPKLNVDTIAQSIDFLGTFAKTAGHATALASEMLFVLASSTCSIGREKAVHCMSSLLDANCLTPAALSSVCFCAQRCEIDAESMAEFITTSLTLIKNIQVWCCDLCFVEHNLEAL